MSYLEDLQNAILKMHGCKAKHAETVPVYESFAGKTVWQGEVEVFDVTGHLTAKRCYAWAHDTDTGKRYFAVLELPPVDSPETAVKAAIMSEIRNARKS